MKKRNQLVSALLTGVLLSSTASASMGTLHVIATAAEENSLDEEMSTGSEDDSDGEAPQDYGDTDGETYSYSGDPEGDDGEEAGSGEEPAVSDVDSEGEAVDSGAESNPEEGESGAESQPSDTESEEESGGDMESGPSEEEIEKEREELLRKEAEEQERLKVEEEESRRAEEQLLAEQQKAEELERIENRNSETILMEKSELEEQLQEESRRVAEETEEAEKKAQTIAYGYAASARSYYSGNYFVTNAQKRLALNVGFVKIDKVPAMPAVADTVYIRESKEESGRVVGTLDSRAICFIIDDTDSDWVYVESGEVRGFALKGALKSDREVENYVKGLGDAELPLAEQKVDPLENTAYRYSLRTTKDVVSILQALGTASVDRTAMIQFAEQFLGNPYVWGGESLTMGCDCSGFTQQIYAQFGISLPRTSYQQAEVGVKIPEEEAVPGDLIFYARDGVVYHVLMYVGDGKAINASSSTTGIIISDVDYEKACWACRYISDTGVNSSNAITLNTSTQASALQAVGQMASNGDTAAQEEIIKALAQASLKEWRIYGFCRSVIIAQAIDESGWLSFGTSAAGIQSTDNNILGMNEELQNDLWTSPWDGKAAPRLVPQYAAGGNVYNFESMRLYSDMESCMEDYAAYKIGLHPDLIGETDVDKVIAVGLEGYATNPNYQADVRRIIDTYDLTRFDTEESTGAIRPVVMDVISDMDGSLELPSDLYADGDAALTDGSSELIPEIEEEELVAEEEIVTEEDTDLEESVSEDSVTEEDIPESEEELILPEEDEAVPYDEEIVEDILAVEDEVVSTESEEADVVVFDETTEEEKTDAEDEWIIITDTAAESSVPNVTEIDTETSGDVTEDKEEESTSDVTEIREEEESILPEYDRYEALFGETEQQEEARDDSTSDETAAGDEAIEEVEEIRADAVFEVLPEPVIPEAEWIPAIPDSAQTDDDAVGADVPLIDWIEVNGAESIPEEDFDDAGWIEQGLFPLEEKLSAAADGESGAAVLPREEAEEDIIVFEGDSGEPVTVFEDGTDEGVIVFDADADTAKNDEASDEGVIVFDGSSDEDVSEDTEETSETTGVIETAEEVTEDGDVESGPHTYTEQEMEIIWAVVAQSDDTSYDGALAVISSVMNRADMNYGGFGTNVFDQITAESQYAYSPDVADPLLYQRRLGGNVPDFVKQAINDCLFNGVRNNEYTSFRGDDSVDGSVQIGANWYFTQSAADAAEAVSNMADVVGNTLN